MNEYRRMLLGRSGLYSIRCAALAVAVYALFILPGLKWHHFDPSIFIVAGDVFVDRQATPTPVRVLRNSPGYDGQFYYRLAMAPLAWGQKVLGVTFDIPSYRMARIGYPLIAWALSLGRPAWVPWSLLITNLGGLAAIAFFAARLSVRLNLDWTVILFVMAWPGFVVSLTRDTTEIVAAAFLLAALSSYASGRMLPFGVLGALATLTRETSIVALGGIFLYEAFDAVRSAWAKDKLKRVFVCGVAMVPFVVWRLAQLWFWGETSNSVAAANLDWPFVGPLIAFMDIVNGTRIQVANAALTTASRANLLGFDLACMAGLAAFSATVLRRSFVCFVSKPPWPALASAFLCLFVLMVCVTGIWIEPHGYLRGFSECFVVGALLLFKPPLPTFWKRLTLVGIGLCWLAMALQVGWLWTMMGPG